MLFSSVLCLLQNHFNRLSSIKGKIAREYIFGMGYWGVFGVSTGVESEFVFQNFVESEEES